MAKVDNKTLYINRGDSATLAITGNNGEFEFKTGDIVYFKLTEQKNESNVILQKEITVLEDTTNVNIELEDDDTRIGDIINKPVTYWYEVSYERDGKTQTIIGYDETGAKLFILMPEAGEINE